MTSGSGWRRTRTGFPKGNLTRIAFVYMLNQWDLLVCYCDDDRLHIMQCLADNAIRPFAVGRRNWLCVSQRRTDDEDVLVAAGCDGQTIGQFDEHRDRNLYRIWNRLSSGLYLPPAVREKRAMKRMAQTHLKLRQC